MLIYYYYLIHCTMKDARLVRQFVYDHRKRKTLKELFKLTGQTMFTGKLTASQIKNGDLIIYLGNTNKS